MTQTIPSIHLFLISDSIGETALKVAQAAIVQFPSIKSVLHKWVFISKDEDLSSLKKSLIDHQGIALLTLADQDLAEEITQFCQTHDLDYFNLLQPLTQLIEKRTLVKPSQEAGAQHELDAAYFKRIEAMEFASKYDDGNNPSIFDEADILLLGISRTSKTPLSMYLATLGYKVTNLPLIPENSLPDSLFKIDRKKIIGLTNDLEIIQKFRQKRMEEFGIQGASQYASRNRIQAELDYADHIYQQLECPVINVADRSIEETAQLIIQDMDHAINH